MAPMILVLNGPNLNLLGRRDPKVYGGDTLADIEAACVRGAAGLGVGVEFRQTNSEGRLVEWIQQAQADFAAIVINAGAYTHTSVAVLDALLACGVPIVEVHLSNIHQREEFRHHSYVSKAAHGMICGFAGHGYELALEAVARMLETGNADKE